MNHEDHMQLIRNGVPHGKSMWADFGSGEGAFTLALRDVAGKNIVIFSIDKNAQSLARQKEVFTQKFPDTDIQFIHADFTHPIDLPPLDGIIAANTIHFKKDTSGVLRTFGSYLKKHARLIIVEYNADDENMWVPYPFSFQRLQQFAIDAGFTKPERIGTIPSHFLREIYAAVLFKD